MIEISSKLLGMKIALLRGKRSVEWLARATDLSGKQIRRLESGESLARTDTLVKIANALGVELTELLDDSVKNPDQQFPVVTVDGAIALLKALKAENDELKQKLTLTKEQLDLLRVYSVAKDVQRALAVAFLTLRPADVKVAKEQMVVSAELKEAHHLQNLLEKLSKTQD